MNDPDRAPRSRTADSDEPELGAEESIPLDGKDPVGEQMMEDLGRERRKEDPERRPGGPGQAEQAERQSAGHKTGDADPGPMPEQLPVS